MEVACFESKDEINRNLIIKISSSTNCKYQFLFTKDSLTVKSENYSYNTLTKKYDSIINIISTELSDSNKRELERYTSSLLKHKQKVELFTTQDLYLYELFIGEKIIKSSICCDDTIMNIIQKVVLPKINKNEIYCNQFFDIIDKIGGNVSD